MLSSDHSVASRRVSFAPEATLHTWDVVELPEDSTTSSASTNSTRRASNLAANAGSPYVTPRSPLTSDASEPTSTPPEQVEELQVAASPAHQRDLHQRKRRRSSAIPPMNFNNLDEFSSSPQSDGDDDTNQTFVTAEEIDKESESSNSNDDDLVEEETVTGVDADDDTLRSVGSNSTGSSNRLEAALQQAAAQAGTQGIDYDEHGDITMEMANDEVTNAFKPWMKKGKYVPQVVGDPSALQDQENLNPFSPAFKANVAKKNSEEEDGAMDMTQAIGGVLSVSEEGQGSPKRRRRKSISGNSRRRSSTGRRRSSGDGSALGDETMDLTMAVGGVQQIQQTSENREKTRDSDDDDEELTMEFTSVIGGVVQLGTKLTASANGESVDQISHDMARRESGAFSENEETMDITFAAGGILLSITERTEPMENQTQAMDFTTAVGAILPEQLSTGNKAEAKVLMEQETDVGQLWGSPFFGTPRTKPIGVGLTDERPLPGHLKAMASDTGSPSLAVSHPRSQSKRDVGARASTTPKSQQPTPAQRLNTPSKQLTPQPTRPTTPGKTPPSKNISMRSASPKKLFKAEIKANKKNTPDSAPKPAFDNPIFRKDLNTNALPPPIVLKPKRRRSSGLGVDREGLGSPRVTAMLDRRGSIGENAMKFVSKGPGVRFEDPQTMAKEVDQERAEDKRRESGRGIMEDEADAGDVEERNATINLKDMIESLTPQKKRLNGRKSLHVGAARGILGKRPAELDEDEDDEDGSKQLKGREGSPVKKIRLPAPPSKAATTGRITRATRRSLEGVTGNANAGTPSGSGSSPKVNTTPKDQPRFKNVESKSPANVAPFDQKLATGQSGNAKLTEEDDRIQLQDFLNMTSIRFMELTTTKRRHTVVPNALLEASAKKSSTDGTQANEESPSDLENCIIAGACTVPMLELYQHVSQMSSTATPEMNLILSQSCRELKNYIAEGRSIVKEIEGDTYEVNPPLFREYMSAPPDVKSIMDNQFKNVKTHARLLSKAMWYEWRMKLLDGLKEGLVKIGEGMNEDDQSLRQQEQLIQPVLPGLIEEHDNLQSQVQIAQSQADEIADCDQDELKEAREDLAMIENDLANKHRLLEELESELREKENILSDIVERKQECLLETKQAEKTLQDCRGWSVAEVSALQGKQSTNSSSNWSSLNPSLANVDALESTHGWSITSSSESTLTMTYNRTLQLFFTPSSFLPNNKEKDSITNTSENSPISLTYIADANTHHPHPLTTEKRFFLQIMRAQLQCLQQSTTTVKDLLSFVSSSWETASNVAEESRVLGVSYIVEPNIISDEVMSIRSTILLQSMRTKVDVVFEVKVRSGDGVAALGVKVNAGAKVCYGEGLKEKKMGEFLESKIKGAKGRGVWVKAVGELEERLRARGKKV